MSCAHRSARRVVNGSGWVQMSAVDDKGTGGHKNEARGDIEGHSGACMMINGRGKFPKIQIYIGMIHRDTDGRGWSRMGLHGCE